MFVFALPVINAGEEMNEIAGCRFSESPLCVPSLIQAVFHLLPERSTL